MTFLQESCKNRMLKLIKNAALHLVLEHNINLELKKHRRRKEPTSCHKYRCLFSIS